MTTIIQFKNIKKQYNDKTIIDNLNLDIEKGEFFDCHWFVWFW